MLEGGGFDVLLVAAGDLPGVAVGVEVLQVVGDGGVGGADCCIIGLVGLGYVGRERFVQGAEAVGGLVWLLVLIRWRWCLFATIGWKGIRVMFTAEV